LKTPKINERTTKFGVVEVVLSSSEVDQIPMCAIDEFCSFAFLADLYFFHDLASRAISRRVRACTEVTWCVGMYQLPTVTFTVIVNDSTLTKTSTYHLIMLPVRQHWVVILGESNPDVNTSHKTVIDNNEQFVSTLKEPHLNFYKVNLSNPYFIAMRF
jgi:hypothetical protein